MNADLVHLLARTCLAAVFIYSGATKFMDWNGTLAEFGAMGIPLPLFAAAATIFVQFAGGVAVLLDYQTRVAALLLAAFTIVATLIGHPFWTFEGVELHRQLTTALEHLAIVGGFILLALYGSAKNRFPKF